MLMMLLLSQHPKTWLQEKLNKLEKKISDWCLQVKSNKTKVIVFSKSGKISKAEYFLSRLT